MKKKIITLTIAFIILLSSFVPVYGEEPLPIKLYGDAAVVAEKFTAEIPVALCGETEFCEFGVVSHVHFHIGSERISRKQQE